MIKEIHRFFILDDKGEPIYIRENYVQGSGNVNYALLSNFINALKSFAKEYGEDQTKSIELGDETIISSTDKMINYQFIIVCDKNSNKKNMLRILNDIQNIYIEKFLGNLYSNPETKKIIMDSFIEALNKLLEPITDFKDFLKSL
jgi:hypothetical protein